MPTTPLTQEHVAAIDRVLTGTPPALALAKRCVDCGMPFQDYVQTLNDQLEMATRTKRVLVEGQEPL